MTVPAIRTMAKEIGVVPGKMVKADLVKAIQTEEGNFPCYQTADGSCDQQDCLWRKDCLK